MVINNQPFTLEIWASRAEMHRALELLQTLLFSLVPVVIAVSCLGGAWLSRRALKPVDEITSAARAIGIENTGFLFVEPGTGDELERLTETWNATLARLDSAVAVLSRFAGDASHELSNTGRRHSHPAPSWRCGASANPKHIGNRSRRLRRSRSG